MTSPIPPVERETDHRRRREGYDRVHVYARRAALTFEASETRPSANGGGTLPTVAIDGAAAAEQPKTYRWSDKLRFQVTPRELTYVTAVFLGYLPGVAFRNHGENHDKGLVIEEQSERGAIYVRLFGKGTNCAVPIAAGDIPTITGLLMRQLGALTGLEGAGLLSLIRASARFYQVPGRRLQAVEQGR